MKYNIFGISLRKKYEQKPIFEVTEKNYKQTDRQMDKSDSKDPKSNTFLT